MPGVDLSQSEGLDETTSLVIRSEIGLEMTRWPTVQHCTSCLGLCPHQRVAGGKGRRRRPKSCAHRAATALRRAAAALHHSPSAFGACFRRMKARLGAPKAITATAPKLARLIYTMLKYGTAYVRRGREEYEQQDRARVVKHMARRAKALGYTLVKAPAGAPVSPALPGAVPGQPRNPLTGSADGGEQGRRCAILPPSSGSRYPSALWCLVPVWKPGSGRLRPRRW